MKTKSGPVPVRLQPWIAEDGTPFIAYATSNQQPKGIEIVGNGTLTHPLDVKLSGVFALAPEMASIVKRVANCTIETCYHCDGSGNTSKIGGSVNEACGMCGGTGRLVTSYHDAQTVEEARAILAKLEAA